MKNVLIPVLLILLLAMFFYLTKGGVIKKGMSKEEVAKVAKVDTLLPNVWRCKVGRDETYTITFRGNKAYKVAKN
ncbi:MAG: hypothetical protein EOO01_09935 [Chitinophagaceae bacterium]|nr:MAG: hypothetical protein EOO01_09935 [Chitinophagaceae bacterium]